MYNSIKRKHCKCSDDCKMYPTFGFAGYFSLHAPVEIKDKVSNRRKIYQKSKNARLYTSSKLRKHEALINSKNEKVLWYKERRYEMTGFCLECGKSTNKDNDKYFSWSIAHIVPKSLIKSVAFHPNNFIELCWQHHSDYDSNFEMAKEMGCFEIAKRKFNQFKHLIPNEELRKINPFLL